MSNDFRKVQGVIIAGVGGQGAITTAQLLLGAVWMSGFHVLQSEVHGMSQRGGAVNAHVVYDKFPVTAPIIEEGSANLLIGLEPLETLRYLPMLSESANLVSSTIPVKNMETYPEEAGIIDELKRTSGSILIDTKKCANELQYKHAGNMALLGRASLFLPVELDTWKEAIATRFKVKGDDVVSKNIGAFEYGRSLLEGNL